MKNLINFPLKLKTNIIKFYRESLVTENLPHTYFRLILLVSVLFVVLAHWYTADVKTKYRVGYPAPIDYYAIVETNYYDLEATNELRNEAKNRIAKVMVRSAESSKKLLANIELINSGRWQEIFSPELSKLISKKSKNEQKRIIAVATDILEDFSIDNTQETDQSNAIWAALGKYKLSQSEKNIVYQMCDGLLSITYEADPELLDDLRESVSSQIPLRKRHLEPGDLIVGKGELVTKDLKNALAANSYQEADFPWVSLLVSLFVTFLWTFVPFWEEKQKNLFLPMNKWLFIASMISIHWMLELIIDCSTTYRCFSFVGLSSYLFLTLHPDLAFNLVLGSGFLSMFLFFNPASCLIAIVCATLSYIIFSNATSLEHRSVIWFKVVTMSLIVSFTDILIFFSLEAPIFTLRFAAGLFFFAFFWGFWVVAGLPIVESVFKILTPFKLLELSSMTHPTLRQLQIEAPGTYNHVLSVANLAETLAEKLKLNSLLVRVGALFHDIGKLKCPAYFVENQPLNSNVHDDLSPVISAKILIGHVKNGYEMAKELKLPSEICDLIIQHHGTTFLAYFYDKAVALDLDVDKKDFTYPGPKPQTKEAALLMIVDSVEAALKGHSKPITSKEDLYDFIDKIIKSKLQALQFERVDFTLKDLSTICRLLTDNCASFNYTRQVKTIEELVGEKILPQGTLEENSKVKTAESLEDSLDEV